MNNYSELQTFEVRLKPYKLLNDANRQTLLRTMYEKALESKKNCTPEPDGICANFKAKAFKFLARYDVRAHKYNCYTVYKGHIYNIGLIPSKSDDKRFNTDLVSLMAHNEGNIDRYVEGFKIRKVGEKFETYLCIRTQRKQR